MAEEERWLDICTAVAIVRKCLGISVGAAQATICEACGSGTVRWRRADWRYSVPIGINQSLTRDAWRRAHIDLDEGEVVDGHRRHRVIISNSDLVFWLSERQRCNPTFEEDDQQLYAPLAEVINRFREANSMASVEDILISIVDRCAKGRMRARARRRIYGSEGLLWIADPIERHLYAKSHCRLSSKFENISPAEWTDLSFDLDERQLPTGELLSMSVMRLAWASVEFSETASNDVSPDAADRPTAESGDLLQPDHSAGKQPQRRGAYVPDLKDFVIQMGAERLRHLEPHDIARLYLDHRAAKEKEGQRVPVVPTDLRSIARQVEPIREDILDQANRAVPIKAK